jgi:hypothetical protein
MKLFSQAISENLYRHVTGASAGAWADPIADMHATSLKQAEAEQAAERARFDKLRRQGPSLPSHTRDMLARCPKCVT